MIKQTDLSKLPVRFIAPDPHLGTFLKVMNYVIWFPLSALLVWLCVLHFTFSLSIALSAVLSIDIALPRSIFWEVWAWPAPVIFGTTAFIGLWPTRVRISPSKIEISALPFFGKYVASTSDVVCTLCMPVRLEMGPLRKISRIYEVVVLKLQDDTDIVLGYADLPGDARAYAHEVANQLGIPCMPGLPDAHQEAPIFYSRGQRFNPDLIDISENAEGAPKGLEVNALDDRTTYRSPRATKSSAQAIIVASLPVGLMLLWHFSGGVWWMSVALGLCGVLVLAWHYYNTRTFAADRITIDPDSISFSKGRSEANDIPLSSIQDVFLSRPGYRFPHAIVVSTDDANHYFSGGLFTGELVWLGRHIAELLRDRQETSTSTDAEFQPPHRLRPSRHALARQFGYEKLYRKRPRK